IGILHLVAAEKERLSTLTFARRPTDTLMSGDRDQGMEAHPTDLIFAKSTSIKTIFCSNCTTPTGTASWYRATSHTYHWR
ncbi:20883_t:CDS:2, partial [Gigaspora rosea]